MSDSELIIKPTITVLLVSTLGKLIYLNNASLTPYFAKTDGLNGGSKHTVTVGGSISSIDSRLIKKVHRKGFVISFMLLVSTVRNN